MGTSLRCVATSADKRYFPALMALLRSLQRTNPRLEAVVFDGGLTRGQARRAARFARVLARRPFIELEGKGKFGYIGNTTLLKFEVSGLEYEKVLYLDADTVVLEDLEPLFSFPEGAVGVVREVNSLVNMFRLQHRKTLTDAINIDWEKPGFNAGIFALRPSEWRDLKEKALELIRGFGAEVFSKTKDQQLLNIIFRNRTWDFDGKYNFSPFYDTEKKYRPAVVHYLSECKPWHREYPLGHYYGEFRRNLSVRDFPGIALVDARRTLRRMTRWHRQERY